MPIMRCPFFNCDDVETLIEETLDARDYMQAHDWMLAIRDMSAFSPT